MRLQEPEFIMNPVADIRGLGQDLPSFLQGVVLRSPYRTNRMIGWQFRSSIEIIPQSKSSEKCR
jgi:hypothetical protein